MGLLASLLEALVGKWFKALLLPALILGALTMAHAAWQKRDAKLIREGEMICNVAWEREVREQEKKAADLRVGVVQSILETERETAGALNDQLSKLKGDMAKLRASASSDSDCLSPSVLNTLRARQGAGGKAGSGKKSGPPAKRLPGT